MEELYREHSRMIYGFLFAKCADADLAEELTQETFYQALRGAHRFRGDSSVSTWLCGIANNIWRRHLTKQSKIRTARRRCMQADAPMRRIRLMPRNTRTCCRLRPQSRSASRSSIR